MGTSTLGTRYGIEAVGSVYIYSKYNGKVVTDPYKELGGDLRTVADHEWVHFVTRQRIWNSFKEAVDALEKNRSCSRSCAEEIKKLAYAYLKVAERRAELEGADYDVSVYPRRALGKAAEKLTIAHERLAQAEAEVKRIEGEKNIICNSGN